ncbi:serine hydrolase domain-containing protein [Hyphomonas sp.]|uniref:serine hydrolase domain-containing protein n=1 Tax=Hyphomonas sp. TaxID=87 RepID=UPI001BCDE3B6|nr:serine hydrolase domain-containing protein [Hyphomonas sp.]
MTLNRRVLMTGLAGLTLTACAHRPDPLRTPAASARRRIEDLVYSAMVPAAGLVVRHRGEVIFAHADGLAQGAAGEADAVPFTPQTPMRVASVSKMATALTAQRLAEKGEVDLDADIRDSFTPALINAAYPNIPITLGHLLGHRSGLRDPDVYWMAAPGRTEDLFTPGMWSPEWWSLPGVGFRYCNFGYGLAGALLEKQTGERFDHLAAREVIGPLGLDAGFNWSGVSRGKRRKAATLYSREAEGSWQVEADGPANLKGRDPAILIDEGARLADYIPGTNGTLFSPQGGLRASLEDMAILARAAASVPGTISRPLEQWIYNPARPNGDTDEGYFTDFGFGVQWHLPGNSPIPGTWLIGHHGEAYGLYSGAFHAPALDAEIAFAVTGTSVPGGDRSTHHPVIVKASEPLWAAAATLLAAL